jgi:V/A-type H+-transporting ATPase subunit K
MEQLMITLGWIGIYAPMALGAIGSIIGCARAGQAACGALLETESGHGRFIGVSAMPSSQTIYGIVVMLTLSRVVNAINAPGLFAIGVLAGLALMFSAIYQGNCCAASINVSKSKPEIFGLSIAPAAVVEGFAVFAFVFALLLSAQLPTG